MNLSSDKQCTPSQWEKNVIGRMSDPGIESSKAFASIKVSKAAFRNAALVLVYLSGEK